MYVIADIAGEFDALMRLVDKLDSKRKIVLVGDLVDRGPKSGHVIEWAMKDKRVITLLGNHEHMMIDYIDQNGIYDHGIWAMNGGVETVQSYMLDPTDFSMSDIRKMIPPKHMNWLRSLPLTYQEGNVFVSHTAWFHDRPLSESRSKLSNIFDRTNAVWTRLHPVKVDGILQLFGHNSQWGLRYFKDENGEDFAICLDDSRRRVLTCYDVHNKQIIQEPYDV